MMRHGPAKQTVYILRKNAQGKWECQTRETGRITSAVADTPDQAVAAADELVVHYRLFAKHFDGECAADCEWCARSAERKIEA